MKMISAGVGTVSDDGKSPGDIPGNSLTAAEAGFLAVPRYPTDYDKIIRVPLQLGGLSIAMSWPH